MEEWVFFYSYMNLETFTELSKKHTAIPVYKRLLADVLTPVSLFLNLRNNAETPFLLESVEGGEHVARYSFLGCNPYQQLIFDGKSTRLIKNGESRVLASSYFETLKKLTTKYSEPQISDLPRLRGGAVGFSSYDTYRQIENLPDTPADDLNLPEAIWSFYDEIYAFDHVKHQVILMKTVFSEDWEEAADAYHAANEALERMEKAALATNRNGRSFSINPDSLQSNLDERAFTEIIDESKKYIEDGEVTQVVLSRRFHADMTGDPFMLYRALRMVNPSPYLFYLEYEDFSIAGSSPEVLVRVQDREARLLPIAGTRRRGATMEEDAALALELINDPKEVSEHEMLVELGISDLSKICAAGTVKVERHQIIERYSHVMHIVSDLSGQLDEDKTAVDALMQCFPAGTVSGAPKTRAMEIIDELEPLKRGIYAGAVGYFDLSGNMDTCIAIRTMVVAGNKVYIQAGAGIVAESIPHNEFIETQNKAGALIQALSVALNIQ